MSICHCGKILPEISSNYRYCSRCGTAHLARCLAPDCKAMVPYQQTPFCASCGTFYRYNEHGAPISCSADKSAESVLYDLLPASGDVLAANALYAKRNAEYPTPSDIGETLYPLAGMPLLREAQLRHNRLYCLTMSGSIEVIDMSTLQTLPQMHTTLPQLASTMIGSYVPTSLEVGTYAFVVRHKNQICGFHTGSGAPLFEFSVEDFQELTTCLNQEHLLVVGSTHQTQEARLYAISDLCRNNTHPRTIKPLTNVSYENLPPRRILPHATGFYVLAQNGALYHIRTGEDASPVLDVLPIIRTPFHHIQAWHVGKNFGAVIYYESQDNSNQRRYQIIVFPVGSFAQQRQHSLNWTPHRHLRSLLIEEDYFYAFDESLTLLCLSRERPANATYRDTHIMDAGVTENIEMFLVPYSQSTPFLIFHSQDQDSHYFAWGRPPLKPMQFINIFPGSDRQIRIFYTANRLVFFTMNNGGMQIKALPSL